jgi:hypothetical protein
MSTKRPLEYPVRSLALGPRLPEHLEGPGWRYYYRLLDSFCHLNPEIGECWRNLDKKIAHWDRPAPPVCELNAVISFLSAV